MKYGPVFDPAYPLTSSHGLAAMGRDEYAAVPKQRVAAMRPTQSHRTALLQPASRSGAIANTSQRYQALARLKYHRNRPG